MTKRTLPHVLGDVQGGFARLNSFINTYVRRHSAVKALAEDYANGDDEFNVIILQTGDMAFYWPCYESLGETLKGSLGSLGRALWNASPLFKAV